MGYIIKDSSLWDISDDIIIYLTDSQVDMIKKFLEEAARKKGMVKDSIEINNYLFTDGGKDLDDWVFATSGVDSNTLKSLGMIPAAGDANTIAKTDANYSESAVSEFQSENNPQYFVAKIKKWQNYNLISKEDYNSLIEAIVLSSPAAHNDWVYSLSGEKDSKQGRERITLDIHDRRIDDPNFALVVRGGVTVGDPENPQDRKKMTVLGETELQDGTAFGRLLDTYGEKNPMEFGHQIPDHGKYPKVYMNRGEDRYNGEDWDDGTYGLGQGTIEAYKEIVSHTTVSADRGIIIEDGVGDPTDRVIEKTTENKENYFKPTGAPTHKTNRFALSIHHDGAKIQGHTYIQDEGSANLFFKEEVTSTVIDEETGEEKENITTTIYKANASSSSGFDKVDKDDIKTGCWFCKVGEDEITDSQYQHFCMNKNGEIEPVEDKWPGHLYYDGILKIKGQEGWKYRIYFINEQQQKDYIEYYYQNGVFYVIESREDTTKGQIYKINDDYFTSNKTLSEILTENGYLYKFKGEYTNDEGRYAERTTKYPIYLVNELTIVEEQSELSYKGHIRVRPEINKVYQIKEEYIETDNLYGLIDAGTYGANTYLYWDGNKFKSITESCASYKQNQDYGSLTIGTRANGEQDNDTIGRNSLEVGSENEAIGNNSAAIGTGNTTAQDSQILVGKYADGADDAIPEANYTEEEEETSQIPRFAVGIGDSSKSKNGFAVSEEGDTYIAGHEQVDGTSDLRKKVTIGADVDDHDEIALEILKHSVFDQNVTIDRDGEKSINKDLNAQMDWEHQSDNSLKVKGQSLFGDTLSIGRDSETYYKYENNAWITTDLPNNITASEITTVYGYDNLPETGEASKFYKVLDGTFWGNYKNGESTFVGLSVHGEIENERIPEDLYTATQIGNELVLNEFADKFWVNSSLSSNSATFRGSYNEDNYESAVGNYANQSTNALKESWLKQKIPNWLKNNVIIYPIETPIETSAPNNTKSAIESSLTNADKNKLYHLTGEPGSGYYYYRGRNNGQAIWEEFSQKPNNNDYCYIQATKTNTILPYVLFDSTYDKNNIESKNTWNEIDDFRKEIAVFRYKYVEDLYSDAGTWVFEFQLNNSGFTQAQWNAINSGLTKESLSDIQYKLNNIIGNFNSFKNIDFENFKNITNATFENLPNNYVTLGSTPAIQEIIGSKIFSTHMSLGIRTETWSGELANQNEQPKIQEQEVDDEDKRKKLQPAQEEAYLCNDNEAYGYYLLPEKDSSGWYTRLASWGKIDSILGDWTDLEQGETIRKVIDGLKDDLNKKYVTIAEDENITGIKTFTNDAGIGFGLIESDGNKQITQSYLKSNENSLGTFLLPNYSIGNGENYDYQNGELALKDWTTQSIDGINTDLLQKISELKAEVYKKAGWGTEIKATYIFTFKKSLISAPEQKKSIYSFLAIPTDSENEYDLQGIISVDDGWYVGKEHPSLTFELKNKTIEITNKTFEKDKQYITDRSSVTEMTVSTLDLNKITWQQELARKGYIQFKLKCKITDAPATDNNQNN